MQCYFFVPEPHKACLTHFTAHCFSLWSVGSFPAASRLSILLGMLLFFTTHSARCQMFQVARLKSPLYVSQPKAPWCSCSHLLLRATKRFYRVEFSRRGTVQLAGTLISAANKKQTCVPPSPFPCVCRCGPSFTSFYIPLQRCSWAVFHQQPEAANPADCVSNAHTQATHKTAAVRAPEERRDAAQTNMSSPQAGTANGPSRKPVLLRRRQE